MRRASGAAMQGAVVAVARQHWLPPSLVAAATVPLLLQAFPDGRLRGRCWAEGYNAARVLARFASRLRDDIDVGHLVDDVCTVVASSVQPAHVSLWLERR